MPRDVRLRFTGPVLFSLVLGIAPSAFAQTAQPTPVPSPAPAATAHAIVGEIVSVDLKANLVTVRESVSSLPQKGHTERRTVTLRMTPATKLLRGTAPTTPADLKPKDFVVARYSVSAAGAVALSLRVAAVEARTTPVPSTAAASGEAPKGDAHRP